LNFIPFALPDIGDEEIDEVADSMRTGWITTGPKVKRFEEEFKEYVGAKYAIAVNSATAGLHLSLEALGVGEGDEVITTTYTFTATAEVIKYLNARAVLVDVDERSINIDVEKIKSAITPRTKAIIPVHIAGLPCNMGEIHALANRHNISVVEDAAHAFPAYYCGKIVGSLGSNATVFSFYATKTITTGEGGMIVTDDENIAKRCNVMRLHGIDREVFNRYRSKKAAWSYEVIAPGYKYNMTDIAAAIGIHQLKKADRFRKRRAKIASMYDAFLGKYEDLLSLPYCKMPEVIKDELNTNHAWHLYVLSVNPKFMHRDEFIDRMSSLGIGTSVHFIPLHRHPYWKQALGFGDGDFPFADKVYSSAVSLPIYSKMTDDDVECVLSAIKKIVEDPSR
jgi:dTDP-4-amino-4,6-dideoxygalactose transaminase